MNEPINKQDLKVDTKDLIRITIDDHTYYCRPLPTEKYFVSTCGKVIAYTTHKKPNGVTTFARPRVLKEYDNGTGYKKVRLCSHTGIKAEYVHRLVCSAYLTVPAGLKRYEVNHLDFNRANNAVANLEVTNKAGNTLHAKTLKHLKPILQTATA